MNVSLPEELEGRLPPQELRLHLALGLFVGRRTTLGQGSAIAGLSQSEFLRELGTRRIPSHYDEADARADVATVDQRGR